MEIPHLVREHLDGEAIEATVSLGDEDVVCVTPTRVLVYRGEGLLSDESVETYSLDVEKLDISEGRRKTKFVFEYVDGTESFTVPGSRAETLLTLLLQGAFRVTGVIGEEESVAGVFDFSELTLVVTDSRLVKHIGAHLWDEDFEAYHYDDVTGLEFEEGSVATQIVITVDGRPQRIKAPNEEAGQVQQTLVQTMCAYYDVGSLGTLQQALANNDGSTAEESDSEPSNSSSGEIGLDEGISPLVGGNSDAETVDQAAESHTVSGTDQGQQSPEQSQQRTEGEESAQKSTGGSRSGRQPSAEPTQRERTPQKTTAAESTTASTPPRENTEDAVDPEDIEAIKKQLSTLTDAVKRQNELLEHHEKRIEAHDERIDQLIEELRRGR